VLETNRNKFLRGEEEAWRLCRRVTWIQSGDSNTKFFHKMASYNRNRKHVWEVISGTGNKITGQEAIKEEAVNHFKDFFRAKDRTDYTELVRISSLYPSMVTEDEADSLFNPVTLEEIKSVLVKFNKDRSPGPDGWTTEFFISFFDLVGEDLLKMVEDSRRNGKLCGGLNSTFLALIPKVNKPKSFDDYRPISLCNLIYKVISKILANRIKPFLSKCLSSEHLGFLKGRRIQDAIGSAHETLHSIKKKNIKSLVLKLDLKKAYDSIDWEYLRVVLLSVGFGVKLMDWIMCCVTSANFAVLINGEATDYFKSWRGLRQGCPLSPYLFILIMEGISLMLASGIANQSISGIKVTQHLKIIHLMFVDDVLVMSKADPMEWRLILDILRAYCSVSGLCINSSKTSVHYWGLEDLDLEHLKAILPFSFANLNLGFKYLGYILKPGAAKDDDWSWLVAKVEKKIGF
jgi:hypothetical protein